MPFKLKLKKSKQYSVVSKSLCVIAVKLLENSTVECILSSRTIGQECLNNVCQRLQIQQPEYFGLKYVTKGGVFKWVDLERPLKKQVDKYAQEFCLYLGVMFHIMNVELLRDEVTRYYFFSHVKSDIIEGKLKCSQSEAIQLASYSLQAEFGDHRPEHHTLEYLKNFVLLPKHLALDNQDALIEQIILSHRCLQGVHHSLAEMYYILAVQQLEGYGEEVFQVKDQNGSEVILGVSIEGINIKNLGIGSAGSFKWSEIVDLIHHKRHFKIVSRDNVRSVQFQLDDVPDAKYIWKMCVQQHKFYMSLLPLKNDAQGEVFRPSSELIKTSGSNSTADVSASHESLDELGVYHTETQNSEQYAFQPSRSEQSLAKVSPEEQHYHEIKPDAVPPIEPVANQVPNFHEEVDFTHVVEHSSYQNLHPIDDVSLETRRAMLPSYRRAPDYETAIRTKYGNLSCSLGDLSVPSTYNQSHSSSVATDSHLDVNRSCNQLLPLQSYSHYGNFIDLTAVGDSGSYNDINRPHMRIVQPTFLPPIHTYSTPELTSQGLTSDINQEHLLANLHLNYQCKPPPPYPYSQRSSSSTPDLTRSNPQTCSSSPDLVSRRNIGGFSVNHTEANYPSSQGSFRHRLGSDTNIYVNNHNFYVPGIPSGHYFHADGGLSNEVPKVNVPVQRTHSLFSSHGNENVSVLPNYITTTPPAWNVQSSQVQQPYIQQVVHVQNDGIPGQSVSQNWNNRPPEDESPAAPPVGPMMMAAMNGLTLSRPDIILTQENEERPPRDQRVQVLENKLAQDQVFLEFEQIIKKKPMADFTTSLLPENLPRNRFKDVLPYEENRVKLTPSKENPTGYINASHVSVSIGDIYRFYIAAQGPLANTVHSFWQMVWENNVSLVVMLTETYEHGREKCYPYWPQENNSKLQFKDFQIFRKATILSPTFTTCSMVLTHTPSRAQRSIWHLQYTDWPDHGCPQDVHGFLNFMEEIESVRRLALSEQPPSRSRNAPIVMHCSAGVGRSGVVILCDILLFCLDHNKPIDVPQVLTLVRMQRMLSVQTLAQYKFVYQVLVQYLKNSRLI